MLQRQTVGRALARAWEARHPRTGPKPDWARRLEPGHVRTWILRVVVSYDHARLADLPTRSPGTARVPDGHLLPKMAADVPAELRQALSRRLADPATWEIVAALGAVANGRAEALRSAIDALPHRQRPPLDDKRLSEWACGIVVRPYRVEPALPDPAWLDGAQAAFLSGELERAARTAKLPSAAEFVTRYGPVYDRMWDDRGAAAVAVLDPVELGLGRLRRPPMTADHNTWIVGTDQSVQQRYRYYLRSRWSSEPAAVAEAAGLRLDDHIGQRLGAAEPDDVCMGELDRACSPIGLRFPEHHALCRSFVAGVERADIEAAVDDRPDGRPAGPGRPRPAALAEWAAAAPALSPALDPALAAAVEASAVHWARYDDRVTQLVTGAEAFWPAQIRWAAARKLWNRLHHREVEWAAPLVRREVARLVRPLFTRHLNQLRRTPIPPPDEPPDPLPVRPDDPLLQATLGMLGADPETTASVVARLTSGDHDWERVYSAAAARWPQPCLSVPALEAWARANLGHQSGEE